jgi:hypothetical protein
MMTRMASLVRALAASASLCGLIVLIPPVRASAQWRVEPLTAAEGGRARAFGEEFVRQLAARRDAAPLVPDWFVQDFPARLADVLSGDDLATDHRGMLLFHAAPELLTSADPDVVLEYYIAHLNFWYLANLHNVSRRTPAELQALATFDAALPVSVSMRLYENPLFSALLTSPLGVVMTPTADGRKRTVDSLDGLRSGIDSLRLAADLLRGDVSRPPAEASENYQEMRRMLAAAISVAPPGSVLGRAAVCETACAGRPAGTRVLEISVLPSLHLHLVESNRQLRVFFVDLPIS